MLAFKDSFATDDEIKNIRDNGESFSVITMKLAEHQLRKFILKIIR